MQSLERALTALGSKLLLTRVNPAAIQRQLQRERYTPAPPPDGHRVRVAVVQLEGRLFSRARDYVAHIYRLVHQAVSDGAQLVVFPEDTGNYPLAGLIPGLERIVSGGGQGSAAENVTSGQAPVLALFRLLAPAAQRVYSTTFATLARSFGAHILAGSTITRDAQGRVYKEAHLYSPDGRLRMTQRKTHLFPTEAVWGLSHDDTIQVVETPVGALAAPICMDHTYFEPIRVAWLQGAEIIIDPAADAARYNFWAQARGVWGRVQESPAYGVQACMVGHILGQEFGGRSGVYAPLALTPKGDGVLAQAATGDSEEVVIADLDLDAMRAYRRAHAPNWNLALYRKYIPAIYARAPGEAGQMTGRRVID
ncbi:MAG: nitrilase [Chloroflexi bacterium]|jgi:predicted amidohydrolase|nr:nitrilase [Chloroflexota bacterium]